MSNHFGAFVRQLERYGERPALVMRPFLRTECLTYAELCRRACQTAHWLLAHGLQASDRILVAAANSPQWVTLFLGAQLAGVTVVSVDAQSTESTLKRFAQQTKPRLFFRGRLPSELTLEVPTLMLEDLPTLIAAQPRTAPKVRLTGQETAAIVFTSGTTADPKGVMLTQANVLANVEGVSHMLAIRPQWRFLSVLPLSHMYELTAGCLTPLSGGCSIYYAAKLSPHAIAESLKTYRITAMLAVPQVLALFLQHIRQAAQARGQLRQFEHALRLAAWLPAPLRRLVFHKVHHQLGGGLEFVVTGGAPIPPDVGRAWERMGVAMLQGYGLTETSPVLTMNTFKRRRLDSPGRALPNVSLRIGAEGEIEASGPGVFGGYWHNAEATKAAFTPDGWFRTGDIGALRDGGWLHIQGRAKFAIVLPSGLKVYPEDVELAADKHPALKAVCVVGLKRPEGEAVHAVLLADVPDAAVDAAVADINNRLEKYQHIATWERWPEAEFPRTRLLKIDRKAVQQWANQKRAASRPPASDTSDALLNIVRLVLEHAAVRIHETDRLSDIGLDSLRRLALVSLIEERLHVSVPEARISPHTTLKQLRALVKTQRQSPPETPRPRWPYRLAVHAAGNCLRETVLRGLLRIWVKAETRGRERLKHLKTPVLVIFNHVDGFDAPVIYNALPWHIRRRLAVAIADDVITKHPLLQVVPRLCYGGYNLARQEPFMPSLEYTGQLVDRGWSIAIAPEGKISLDGRLQPFKAGIGLLAVELGIPVVPVKTAGLFGTMPLAHRNKFPKKRSRILVRIGEPVSFGRDTSYESARQELERIMREL